MRKLILATVAVASLIVSIASPALAYDCKTVMVNGRYVRMCW